MTALPSLDPHRTTLTPSAVHLILRTRAESTTASSGSRPTTVSQHPLVPFTPGLTDSIQTPRCQDVHPFRALRDGHQDLHEHDVLVSSRCVALLRTKLTAVIPARELLGPDDRVSLRQVERRVVRRDHPDGSAQLHALGRVSRVAPERGVTDPQSHSWRDTHDGGAEENPRQDEPRLQPEQPQVQGRSFPDAQVCKTRG